MLDSALELPFHGTVYRVPPAPIGVGLKIVLQQDVAPPELLGAAHEEMVAARLPLAFLDQAALAVIAEVAGRRSPVAGGRELAEATWNGDAAPPAGSELRGLEALEEYGRGDRDPVTGLFECYEDLPPSMAAQGAGEEISWSRIADLLDVVEYCFAADLGVDLADVWGTKSWRWFAVRVKGLLAADTLLAPQFREQPTPATDDSAASPRP